MKTCLTFNPRLHPIASFWGRLLNQDVVISGYNVPANVSILSLFLPILQFFFFSLSSSYDAKIRISWQQYFWENIFEWHLNIHRKVRKVSRTKVCHSFKILILSPCQKSAFFLRNEKDSAWIEKNLCWDCVRIKILNHPGLIAVQLQQQTNIAANFKEICYCII